MSFKYFRQAVDDFLRGPKYRHIQFGRTIILFEFVPFFVYVYRVNKEHTQYRTVFRIGKIPRYRS